MKAALTTVLTAIVLAPLAGYAGPAGAQAPAAGSVRIAFVDAAAALQAMPGYAVAESTFQAEFQAAQVEIQRIQATFDSLRADFEQQQAMLTPTARQTRRQQVDNRGQQLARQADSLNTHMARRETELLQPMQQRLVAVLEGMRAEQNYVMIIDLNAREHGIITFDRSLDITRRVIERLRQGN